MACERGGSLTHDRTLALGCPHRTAGDEPRMSILIVEDNALIAMTIESMLMEAGFSVIGSSATTRQALDMASAQPPRVALVNIHLSDDTSGAELARALKARWGTAIVFMTGEPADAPEHREIAIGLLNKPCTDEALLAAVRIAHGATNGEAIDRAAIPHGLRIF